MEHCRVATYEITKGTFQEVADTAKSGMLRKFQEQPGFIRYGVADLGDKKCLSISLWETRDQAQAARKTSRTVSRSRRTPWVTSPSSRASPRPSDRAVRQETRDCG